MMRLMVHLAAWQVPHNDRNEYHHHHHHHRRRRRHHHHLALWLFTFFCAELGLSLVVALFVFGFKVAEEISEMAVTQWFLSWSFSLACTAFVLSQIAASILLTENKRLFLAEMERSTDDSASATVTDQRIFVQPVEVKIINNENNNN